MTRRESDTEEIVVSASSIATFLACPMRWYYRYRMRMEPRGWNPNLERGSAVHRAVQAWWNGGSVSDAMRDWLDESRARMTAGEYRTFMQDWDHVRRLVDRYVAHYGERPGGRRRVLGTEVEISYQLVPGLRVLGYVDIVFDEPGGLEIKTGQSLARRMSYLAWDPQPISYVLGLRTMGFDVRSVLFDGIKTYRYVDLDRVADETLFKRRLVTPTEPQMDEFKRNCLSVVRQIRAAEGGGMFTRNLGSQCNQCDFQDPCHAAVMGDTVRETAAWRTHFRVREERQ